MEKINKRKLIKAYFQKNRGRKWALICVLVAILLIWVIPIIINEVYKVGHGYLTLWNAADVLSYYSVILSGIISITTVVATIFYTRNDLEKQINFSKSQFNVPFFIIDKIYLDSDQMCFTQTKGGQAWQIEYIISRQKTSNKKISIVLRNIGDGIAIAPSFMVNLRQPQGLDSPVFVDKSDEFKIEYNPKDALQDMFGPSLLPQKSQIFQTIITLSYQNISGVQYTQDIILEHNCDIERNSVIILINGIKPQKVELQ